MGKPFTIKIKREDKTLDKKIELFSFSEFSLHFSGHEHP
jgi:hypothetical protein